MAGKALREALGAFPCELFGLLGQLPGQSGARAVVKRNIDFEKWARAIVKRNIDFEKWARAVVKRNIDFEKWAR